MANSSHQDYRLQLFLEQQNKRRVMMARQEGRENINEEGLSLQPTPPHGSSMRREPPSKISDSNPTSPFLPTPPRSLPTSLDLDLARDLVDLSPVPPSANQLKASPHHSFLPTPPSPPFSHPYLASSNSQNPFRQQFGTPNALYFPMGPGQLTWMNPVTLSDGACGSVTSSTAGSVPPRQHMPATRGRASSDLAGDSGYNSLSSSEVKSEPDTAMNSTSHSFSSSETGAFLAKDLSVIMPKSPPNWNSMGSMASVGSGVSHSSARTQDSGYASDLLMDGRRKRVERKSRTKKSRKPDPKTSKIPPNSTLGAFKEALRQSLHMQCPRSVETDGGQPICANDGSRMEGETSAGIPSGNTPPEQVTAQSPQAMATDAPLDNAIDSHIEDTDSALNSGYFSRSPSPWQAVDSTESEQALARSLWWILNGLNDDITSSQASVNSSPGISGTDSPVIASIEGARAHAAGPGSGSSSLPAAGLADPDSNNFATSTGSAGLKRTRGSSDSTRDSDDGDEKEPNRKRLKLATPERPLLRPRFACPYQKYDPWGSPFCCMPSNKNPEGGADTFSRVK